MENQANSKAFGAILIILALVFTGYIAVKANNAVKEGRYIGQPLETKNTITVSDKGEIYAKPDLAITSFSVITEAKTVALAMSENTEKMNAVIKAVADEGVKEEDRKTTNFSIYPRYEYYESSKLYPSGRRVLVGYDVNQSLEVKIREMEKIGTIIEKAISAGANETSDLQFTIDKQDALKSEARAEAIAKAKAKAEELAKQLGVKLVRITSFSESSVSPYYYSYKEAMTSSGEAPAPAPDIQTGQTKIEVSVSITYEII